MQVTNEVKNVTAKKNVYKIRFNNLDFLKTM